MEGSVDSSPMRISRATAVEVNWSTLLRELVVTTLGVLIALALNSWWGVRQDRARERAYLRQLTADIDRSLAPPNLPDALARETRAAQANVALLRAFRMPIPPPPDSIARWLYETQTFTVYTPLTATAHALISSRDISLIRDESVRIVIVAMASTADQYATRTHDYQLKWQTQAEALERTTDYLALKMRVLGPAATDSAARTDSTFEIPAGVRREPFRATEYGALLRDRDVYRALVKMNTAHRNTLDILREEDRGLRSIRPLFAGPVGM
jgi:hypothetical protein